MRALWRRLKDALTVDDLFWRVVFFLFALFMMALCVVGVGWLLTPDARATWWVWQVLLAAFMAGLFFCAAVMFGGCFASPGSRWSRWAQKATPDAVDIGEAIFIVAVIFLPAVVITVLLRYIGVRGCK